MIPRRFLLRPVAAAAACPVQGFLAARAENLTRVADTKIKIGQTMSYSGPTPACGMVGRTEAAYFKMMNDKGGINGRNINPISLDDATARRRRSSTGD